MFDNTAKQNQPASSPASAPSTSVGEETIYTMPMEYYLGEKTTSAVRGGVVSPSAAPIAAPAGKKSGGKTILIVLVIVILLGVSGYLLYASMLPAAPAATPALQQPAVTAPTVPVEEPKIETPVVPAVTEPAATTPVGTPATAETTFDPTKIRKAELSLVSAVDTDKDGLTNIEEDLFTTDLNLFDTDGDGYKDGAEVSGLFSPLDKGNVLLSAKPMVKEYANEKQNYKILIPKDWLINSVDAATDKDVLFTSSRNEFINVLVDDLKPDQTIDDWYLEKVPTLSKSEIRHFTTLGKIPVIESPDGFTVYFAKDNLVYIINYNIGLKEAADYPTVFQVVVNSFAFLK
jgi:hypothetical protein